MDGNKVRAILSNYGKEFRRIQPLVEEYEYLRHRLESPAAINYNTAHRKGSYGAESYTVALLYRAQRAGDRVIEQQTEAVEALNKALELLETLPDNNENRRALELKYIDLLSDEEAVRVLGASLTTYYRRIRAGVASLAQNYEE